VTRSFALFSAFLLAACSAPEQAPDPQVSAALEEIRALQFQPTCETTARPEGEPYWSVYIQSDGSERLEFSNDRLNLTTDWPGDFRPTGAPEVQCRTAYIANEAAKVLESHGLDWRVIEVQAVQTAGLQEGQVRAWGRQEKRPEGSEFFEGA